MLLFLICSFFIHTSSTASYTLSLHDALPISVFFPNQDPSSPGVCRLSDTKPFHSTFFQVLVGDISRIGVMETRCEGPQLCISRPQIHFPPGCAFVVGHKCRLITNRINDRLSVLS